MFDQGLRSWRNHYNYVKCHLKSDVNYSYCNFFQMIKLIIFLLCDKANFYISSNDFI